MIDLNRIVDIIISQDITTLSTRVGTITTSSDNTVTIHYKTSPTHIHAITLPSEESNAIVTLIKNIASSHIEKAIQPPNPI